MEWETGGELTCTIGEEEGSVRLLRLRGELCLPAVDGLRRALIDVLEGGAGAAADLGGVAAVDLAGLQLLCSAHRSFQHAGRSFRLRDVSQAFRRTAEEAGFRRECSTCGCRQSDCLWDF